MILVSAYVISKCKCFAGIAALTISRCCSHSCRMNLGSRSCASSSNADVFWPNIRYYLCLTHPSEILDLSGVTMCPSNFEKNQLSTIPWSAKLQYGHHLWNSAEEYEHFSFEVLSGSASLCIEKEDHCLDLFCCFYTSIWVWLKVWYPIPSIGVSPFARSNGTFGGMHIRFQDKTIQNL